jgi:integrase
MVMIAMCLGLCISEIRALQWPDFDLKGRTLMLTRSIVGRYVWNGGKTGASEDEVFLGSKLVCVLEDWRNRCVETPEAWLFANSDTKRPVHGDAIQKDYLRPVGEKIGLQEVGWHSFQHSYRTLIDDIGTPLGVQQRLMRHADIKTTINTYGSAFEKTKRRANSRVADLVLPLEIKKQLKGSGKEVSLKNLKPETDTIQGFWNWGLRR